MLFELVVCESLVNLCRCLEVILRSEKQLSNKPTVDGVMDLGCPFLFFLCYFALFRSVLLGLKMRPTHLTIFADDQRLYHSRLSSVIMLQASNSNLAILSYIIPMLLRTSRALPCHGPITHALVSIVPHLRCVIPAPIAILIPSLLSASFVLT